MLAAPGCVIRKGATRAGLDADPAGQWHYLPSTNIDPVACARAPSMHSRVLTFGQVPFRDRANPADTLRACR